MLIPILAAGLVPRGQAKTVVLHLSEGTALTQSDPKLNLGREPGFGCGPGKVVLIRFPELPFVAGPAQRVAGATLHLVRQDPGPLTLKSVSLIRRPWEAGAGRSINFSHPGAPAFPNSFGAATWTYARWDDEKWASPGASDPSDAELVPDAAMQVDGQDVVVTGLGIAAAKLSENPSLYQGLRLEFGERNYFFSSEVPKVAPSLEVQVENRPAGGPDLDVVACEAQISPDSWPVDGTPVKWTATVRNDGDSSAAKPHLAVTYLGKALADQDLGSIAPGSSATVDFSLPWKNEHRDHRGLAIAVSAKCDGDTHPGNDTLLVNMDALPVYAEGPGASRAVAYVNQVVLPLSKSGAALEGCLERIRLVTDPAHADIKVAGTASAESVSRALAGIPDAFARPPLLEPGYPPAQAYSLFSDTRDDSDRPSVRALPTLGWELRAVEPGALPDPGLLSRIEVDFLDTQLKLRGSRLAVPLKLPQSAVLWCLDGQGNPLPNAKVEIFRVKQGQVQAAPFATIVTNGRGSIFLPKLDDGHGGGNPIGSWSTDGSDAWSLVRVTEGGATESAWLGLADLWSEASRGNVLAPFIELRFMLTTAEVDESNDVAQSKIVTDSANHLPAQLNALVDGDPKTLVDFGAPDKGQWIEFDLGRDRMVAEVQLEIATGGWEQFDILRYGTSQTSDQAVTWYSVKSGPALLTQVGRQKDGRTILTLRAPAAAMRYLRIVPKSGPATALSAVRVYAAKGS